MKERAGVGTGRLVPWLDQPIDVARILAGIAKEFVAQLQLASLCAGGEGEAGDGRAAEGQAKRDRDGCRELKAEGLPGESGPGCGFLWDEDLGVCLVDALLG